MKTTRLGSRSESPSGNEAPRRGAIALAGTVALLLLVIGGLNWGLVGVADVNAVEWLFGRAPWLARSIYAAVGVAAVYCAFMLPRWSRAG